MYYIADRFCVAFCIVESLRMLYDPVIIRTFASRQYARDGLIDISCSLWHFCYVGNVATVITQRHNEESTLCTSRLGDVSLPRLELMHIACCASSVLEAIGARTFANRNSFVLMRCWRHPLCTNRSSGCQNSSVLIGPQFDGRRIFYKCNGCFSILQNARNFSRYGIRMYFRVVY